MKNQVISDTPPTVISFQYSLHTRPIMTFHVSHTSLTQCTAGKLTEKSTTKAEKKISAVPRSNRNGLISVLQFKVIVAGS